jgi:hypothetical protein
MDVAGKMVAEYNFAKGISSGVISKPASGTYLVRVSNAGGQSAVSRIIFE